MAGSVFVWETCGRVECPATDEHRSTKKGECTGRSSSRGAVKNSLQPNTRGVRDLARTLNGRTILWANVPNGGDGAMKWRRYLLALAVLLAATCCLCAILRTLAPLTGLSHMLFPGPTCTDQQPPAGFESDLIGTWQTLDPDNLDTLILREDHQYKQIIHRVPSRYNAAADYESDWLPWWVQYNPKSVPYLHLKGMHPCIAKPWLGCDVIGGGGFDPCLQVGFGSQSEGILLIVRRRPGAYPFSRSNIALLFVRDSEGATEYTKQLP